MPSRPLPSHGLGKTIQRFDSMSERLDRLEQPDGNQLNQSLAKVEQLLTDLPSLITSALAAGFHSTGTMTADGGVTSAGVYALDVTTLPGTRRANWTVSTGQIGYAPSSALTKNILGEVEISAAQFLACAPVVFEYLGQIDIRDNPENPHHDPSYVVPREIGHIAEVLIENGCGAFVFTHDDGSPAGIDYAAFGAVGFVVVGRDHEARIRMLENMIISIGEAAGGSDQ